MIDVLTPLSGRSADSEAAYRDLVLEIVEAGEFDPTPERSHEIRNLLDRTNRPPERFQFDVNLVTRRREAASKACEARKLREKADDLLREWRETEAEVARMPKTAEREAAGDKLTRLYTERVYAMNAAKSAEEWHAREMQSSCRRTEDGRPAANWNDWREFEVASDEHWESQQAALKFLSGSGSQPLEIRRVG